MAANSETRIRPVHLAKLMDAWLTDAAKDFISPDSSTLLVAVGGYGRGELFPHSDVDILVSLGEGENFEQELFAQSVFMPLWDARFDLGHALRTPSETLTLASADFEVLCALLDARLLAGSPKAFDALIRGFHDAVLRPRAIQLIEWLKSRFVARQDMGADSAHRIAPNLKEGRGGLRDYQTIVWLEKIATIVQSTHRPFLSTPEREALEAHADFLAETRVHLHVVSNRKNEVLHLEIQPDVAQAMGHKRASRVEGVEHFLSLLHQAMVETKLLCGFVLNRAMEELSNASGTRSGIFSDGLDFSFFARNPLYILELFHHSAMARIPLSWQARRTIQSRLEMLADDGSWQQGLASRFETILCTSSAADALEQMLEIGLLGIYFPEFRLIEHLVQFDAYHMLPAGPHMVETVRQLCLFEAGHPFLGEQLHACAMQPALRWAALFHDIGKGNGEHALRGAAIAGTILQRLGFESLFINEVSFLIENHLLLIHSATRHDLSEESVIMHLAHQIGTVARLDALTLLTWADSMATGPKAWNPWIQNLLSEAYFKTRRVLEYGFLSSESRVHRLSKSRDALRSVRPENISVSEYESFLAVMPPRYLMRTSHRRLVEHIHQVHSFRTCDPRPEFLLKWEHKPTTRSLRLTFVSDDRPGLFARFCAALSRKSMSVLGAELCVWDDGTVVDVFWVTEPLDPLYIEDTLESFQSCLLDFFRHEEKLDAFTVQIGPRLKKVIAVEQEPVVVHLDNKSSDFYSVLSIQAPDVPGLLATVSLTLYRLGIDLVFAKIATQRDKAMDILHVRQNGEKIPVSEILHLERSLRLVISSLYA